MAGPYYTLGVWRVKEGKAEEFIAAWKAVGEVFYALPHPPGPGTLLRSESDPSLVLRRITRRCCATACAGSYQ